MTTEVEHWVDEILDRYEAWLALRPGEPPPLRTRSWVRYLKAHPSPRPAGISAFTPSVVQDAIIWLHDGGMSPPYIASVLGIPDPRPITDALQVIEDQYEDVE